MSLERIAEIAEIAEIVEERWRHRSHAKAHFRMADATLALLRARWAQAEEPPFSGTRGRFFGTRIVVDESVPVGRWQLVDDSTGSTWEDGIVDEEGGHG